jgi:uncharacterized membrane protein YoaK (UPF0700 family)
MLPIPLIVALSVCSGATDALSILRLGNVFSSVMTGNLVLLGIGVGRRQGSLALHAGLAIVGFALGVLGGAHICPTGRTLRDEWARGAAAAIRVELVLLAALTVFWLSVSGAPTKSEGTLMLLLTTVAMGLQSAVIRAAPEKVPSTTYMTGSLTDVVSEVASRRAVGTQQRTLVALVALVAGAACMALLVEYAHQAAPVLLVVALAVSLASVASHRRALRADGAVGT